MMAKMRYWVLSLVVVYLVVYLIDTGREEEAKKFANWSELMMPKIKSGQLIIK
jgi:hypothetical protein